jgi:ABC-type Fe3+-hydroxamate transport system substrate-binding protein
MPVPRLGHARALASTGAAVFAALVCACERAPPPGDAPGPQPDEFTPVELTDAAGRTHDFRSPPTRIVSLVPSASAILVALAEHGRVVGRTDYDTAQVLASVPSVGGGQEPNLEVLLSLQPDLVIRFEGPQDQRTPEQLDRVGIPHYAIRPDGIQDVRRIITEVGSMLGRRRGADSLVTAIDHALETVQARVSALPPVRAAFVMGGTPPWVAGPGTFIHELIRIGGGVNVFADLNELYAPISPEELVARGADVYLLLEGTELDVRVARGVRVQPVGAGVQMPGPNLGDAAFEVARALHPDWVP